MMMNRPKLFFDSRFVGPFLGSFAAGLAVHFIFYTNGLMTPDGTWHELHSISGTWEVSLGRWGLFLADWLRSGINSAPFIAFVALALCSLSGIVLAILFQVKNRWLTLLLCTSLTCSPMMAMFLLYPYCAIPYSLSLLLGVLAVYFAILYKKDWQGIALGVVCLTAAASFYQTAFGVTLAAFASYLLLFLLNQPQEFMQSFSEKIKRMLITMFSGGLLYYLLLKLSLILWDTPLSSYKDASSVGLIQTLEHTGEGIRQSYRAFFDFFFKDWIAKNAYGEKWFYLGIFCCALVLFLQRMIREIKSPSLFFISAALICLFPVCANPIFLILPGTELYLLMASGLMITVPMLIGMIDTAEIAKEEKGLSHLSWLKYLAIFFTGGLIWSYGLTNQLDGSVILTSQKQGVQLANRIWTQLEASETYLNGKTTLLIAGSPEKGHYAHPYPELLKKANAAADYGIVWNTFEGNTHTWSAFFRMHLGVDYIMCSPEKFEAIALTREFQEMPLYPEKGSMKMIDETYVVKISEAYWETSS